MEDDVSETKGVRRRKNRPVITRVDDPNEAIPDFMRERKLGSRTASSSSWWAGLGAPGTEHLRETQDPTMLRPDSLFLEETEFESTGSFARQPSQRRSVRETAVDDVTISPLVRNATPSIRSRNNSYHHVTDLDRASTLTSTIEYDEPVLPGGADADPMAYTIPDRTQHDSSEQLYEVPHPSTGQEQTATFQRQASGRVSDRSDRSSARRRSLNLLEDRTLAGISEHDAADSLHFARAGSQRDEDAIREFQPTLLMDTDDELSRQPSRKPHPLARQGSLRKSDI